MRDEEVPDGPELIIGTEVWRGRGNVPAGSKYGCLQPCEGSSNRNQENNNTGTVLLQCYAVIYGLVLSLRDYPVRLVRVREGSGCARLSSYWYSKTIPVSFL